jgi:hypothetical protein
MVSQFFIMSEVGNYCLGAAAWIRKYKPLDFFLQAL